jgi:prolyl oligopeptidase
MERSWRLGSIGYGMMLVAGVVFCELGLRVVSAAEPTEIRRDGFQYPTARRSSQQDDYHGTMVSDPYRWMEDLDSPETKAWVSAERALTASALAGMPERAALHRRLTALWNYPRYGLPFKRGGRVFFRKNDGLQNQSVLYVTDPTSGPAGAAPRVLIDPNALSATGNIALATIEASDDGRWLGYGLATAGSDWNEFHVRAVESGRDTADLLKGVKFSNFAWTKDNAGFFYARYPEVAKGDALFGKLSGRQLRYHRLGTAQSADPLVFSMPEHPEWMFYGDVTEDGRFLILTVEQNGLTHNALYVIDLRDPGAPRFDGPVVKLLDAFDAEYSFVTNRGSTFLVETTRDAPRGRVVAIDLAAPAPSAWRTVVPQGEDSIEEVVAAGRELVVLTLHDVQSRLGRWALDGRSLGAIPLPGIGSVSGLSGKEGDPELFFGFSSFLTPPSILRQDLSSGRQGAFQQAQTTFAADRYETRQVFYPSRDGTRIPMFVTARKGLKLDGSSPCWLYGYGGFNISLPAQFSVPPLVWLELGGIYAQANLRGGGEFGEAWHLAGTKERKQNVFDDFIAGADWLVAHGYTRRDRLMISGRSNGGLLIGAVLNQRPDLCAVALPGVGVMDMLRFHKFTVGAAWISDYGSSDDAEGFRYLRAYSPVHTVKPGAKYPPVMIITGDHDDRVFPAHSFKYAATMQAAVAGRPDAGPVLIRIDTNTGHGGSSGSSPVSKTIDEWADQLAFAVHYLPAGAVTWPDRTAASAAPQR